MTGGAAGFLRKITVPKGLGTVDEFTYLKTQTDRPVKATCPGPVTLSIHVQTRPGDAYNNDRMALCWDLVPAVKDQVGKLADQSLASGLDAATAVGKAAESAAQSLDQALPALAGYVRSAAEHSNKFADGLRDKKAEELLASAVSWSRQQPLLALAGAALVGFALSRIVKTGVAPGSPSNIVQTGQEGPTNES